MPDATNENCECPYGKDSGASNTCTCPAGSNDTNSDGLCACDTTTNVYDYGACNDTTCTNSRYIEKTLMHCFAACPSTHK